MFFLIADIYPHTYLSIAMKFGHYNEGWKKEKLFHYDRYQQQTVGLHKMSEIWVKHWPSYITPTLSPFYSPRNIKDPNMTIP